MSSNNAVGPDFSCPTLFFTPIGDVTHSTAKNPL